MFPINASTGSSEYGRFLEASLELRMPRVGREFLIARYFSRRTFLDHDVLGRTKKRAGL